MDPQALLVWMLVSGDVYVPVLKAPPVDLCAALTSVARRVCSSYVDPSSIVPLLSCPLIAHDKQLRPIGISDTARRIIAKAALTMIAPDIQDASGCLQMCCSQISGIEAAVNATIC